MRKIFIAVLCSLSFMLKGQTTLSPQQKSLVSIASFTATGDLDMLKGELSKGLDVGLTINQIKEAIIHLYAYAGFPRSIRGLQTFMDVLDERKRKGTKDVPGAEASPVKTDRNKYEQGKAILEQLTGVRESNTKTGYAAFAPILEIFLKEHLFADIFERDILTYKERELITISVLSSLGGLEPMLRSHINIGLNIGLSSGQIQQCMSAGLASPVFSKGQIITNNNFTGTAYLNSLVTADSSNSTSVGNVSFEPGARSKWHLHPAGQILLATDGVGYYQEKGQLKKILRKGDVVKCPPNIPHWHGASADTAFVQIAITGREKGETVWLEAVTDDEYNK